MLNADNGLPEEGLANVLSIKIVVDKTADFSDFWLHACYTPGRGLFFLAVIKTVFSYYMQARLFMSLYLSIFSL